MAPQSHHDSSPDLLSLSLRPMAARVAAIEAEWALPAKASSLPPRAVQIAGLIVAETVRLIRLGTREELAASALELAQLSLRAERSLVAKLNPEAVRLVGGASLVLGAAGAPSSSGGEEAVLRSWNGRARQAVEILSHASGQALPRAELRARLGNLGESYLSHLLADLEASGLAVRIKEGRTVTVHLGPTGREEHVQERVAPQGYWPWGTGDLERNLTFRPGADPSPAPIPNEEPWIEGMRMRDLDLESFLGEDRALPPEDSSHAVLAYLKERPDEREGQRIYLDLAIAAAGRLDDQS